MYLGICAIFQNEARYLGEWIGFHRLMGADHFYLYDNNSTDHFQEVLAPWIANGLVTLISWPMPYSQGAQRQAYNECLNRAKGQVRWLVFIDIDEFLFSPSRHSLPAALRPYEAFPGVVVHWQIFGSKQSSSDGCDYVIERFTHRAPRNWVRNRQVKSIVNPSQALMLDSPHHFGYKDNLLAVNEAFQPVQARKRPKVLRRFFRKLAWMLGPWSSRLDLYNGSHYAKHECPCDVLRIHHYIVKSEEEFASKATRRKLKWTYATSDRVYQAFFRYHDRNEIEDRSLLRFLPALRSCIAENQVTSAKPKM